MTTATLLGVATPLTTAGGGLLPPGGLPEDPLPPVEDVALLPDPPQPASMPARTNAQVISPRRFDFIPMPLMQQNDAWYLPKRLLGRSAAGARISAAFIRVIEKELFPNRAFVLMDSPPAHMEEREL